MHNFNTSSPAWRNVPLSVCEAVEQFAKTFTFGLDKQATIMKALVEIVSMIGYNAEVMNERSETHHKEILIQIGDVVESALFDKRDLQDNLRQHISEMCEQVC